MWIVIERANGREVCHEGFATVEDAATFIIKGGAHNFDWVGNKVTYEITYVMEK